MYLAAGVIAGGVGLVAPAAAAARQLPIEMDDLAAASQVPAHGAR